MAKEKSSSYPATTWAECKSLLERFETLGVSVISTSELAKEYGLSSSHTKSFQYRLSTARQYGLVDVRNQTVSLTELGKDVLHPSKEDARRLELQCFANPPLHKALLQKFDARPIPRIDLFENVLVREFGIAEGAKKRAAECFMETATELKIIAGGVFCYAHVLESLDDDCGDGTFAGTHGLDASVDFADKPRADTRTQNVTVAPPRQAAEIGVIVQRIPLEGGGVLEFSVPVTATADELLMARDIFDILLQRRFGVGES